MVLKTQFHSVKFTVVTRMGNNFEQLLILFKRYKAITVCWCKQPISNSFQTCLYSTYLFKLYCKSVMILPVNDFTNICREIRKIRLILWMTHTCNMKGLEEVETLGRKKCTFLAKVHHCTSLTFVFVHRWRCTLLANACRWPRSWVIAVDHTSKFKAIYSIVNPLLMV